jgi:hypothetical protein
MKTRTLFAAATVLSLLGLISVSSQAADQTFIKITEGPIVTELDASQGARWWDYNNDGWLDLYVNHAAFGSGTLSSFFHNNGDGTFTKIPTNALATVRKRFISCAVGDFDNDGDEDIYVLSNATGGGSEPRCDLYRNDGNGRFTPVSGPWQQDADSTIDCSLVDYDRDGFLDVFVVNGLNRTTCLYRQTAPGTFVKMTAAQVGSILTSSPEESYNCAWADYDNDGDPDVWLENYKSTSQLHRNDGQAFFTRVTDGSIVQGRSGGLAVWGDYDNDGFLDLFAGGDGSGGPFTNALHRNLDGFGFTNVATSAGVALKMACYAPAWGDYDNDGWLDLFTTSWYASTGTNILFHNRGDGTFEAVDVGSPIHDGAIHAVVSWADYDNDGFLDLFLGCGDVGALERNHLYRNNARGIGNANHWLKIKLNGQASNRSGIGAKVRVNATIGSREFRQVREITGNGSSATGHDLLAHFGLGHATTVTTVHIEWPSGIVQGLTNVAADQVLSITEHQVYVGPAPAFARATASPAGLDLSITEPAADAVYVLETSTDLVTWTKLMARTSTAGTHSFTDARAINQPARFYRLVVP